MAGPPSARKRSERRRTRSISRDSTPLTRAMMKRASTPSPSFREQENERGGWRARECARRLAWTRMLVSIRHPKHKLSKLAGTVQHRRFLAALGSVCSGAPGIMLPSGKQRASAQNPQHAQQMTAQRQLRKRFWEQVSPDVRMPYVNLIGRADGYRDINVAQSALWKASKGMRQQQQPTWQLQWMDAAAQPGGGAPPVLLSGAPPQASVPLSSESSGLCTRTRPIAGSC